MAGGRLTCAATWPTSARPTTLAALLLDPPHGLLHQSYAPTDMRGGGTVNADGFGAGWYPPAAARSGGRRAGPVPHVRMAAAGRGTARPQPIWADTAFAALAAVTTGTAVLAAVRSATVGHAGHRAGGGAVRRGALAVQPQRAWSAAGRAPWPGWPPSCPSRTCSRSTPHGLRAALGAGPAPPAGRRRPAAVLADVVRAVEAAAPGSRLNLLLTDGTAVWATTWTHALSVRAGRARSRSRPNRSTAAAGWVAVPDRHLVVATPQRCEVRPWTSTRRFAGSPRYDDDAGPGRRERDTSRRQP